jgi:uncharacterized protein YqeY
VTLKVQIQQDMKDAMRSGDKRRLGAIRLILAAIKQREVDDRIELNDAQVVNVLDKMTKQRRDSLEQYQQAGRDDLAEQETFELEILKAYLPAQLDDAEIDALIDAAIQATGAASMKDMGKVMGELKPQLQGRADMGAVSSRIKNRLSG